MRFEWRGVEKVYHPNQLTKVERNQSFKLITTRVFHTGIHQLSIIINGTESEVLEFKLITTRVFHTGAHQLSIIINGTESEILEFELID